MTQDQRLSKDQTGGIRTWLVFITLTLCPRGQVHERKEDRYFKNYYKTVAKAKILIETGLVSDQADSANSTDATVRVRKGPILTEGQFHQRMHRLQFLGKRVRLKLSMQGLSFLEQFQVPRRRFLSRQREQAVLELRFPRIVLTTQVDKSRGSKSIVQRL